MVWCQCIRDCMFMFGFLVLWMGLVCVFFFFKQRTAYEVMPSFVGSEMCIGDSLWSSVVGRLSLVFALRSLVFGRWSLVFALRSLVVGTL